VCSGGRGQLSNDRVYDEHAGEQMSDGLILAGRAGRQAS
jgi:hypothetical protein